MPAEYHYILFDLARSSYVEVFSPMSENWEKMEFSTPEDAEEFVKTLYEPIHSENNAYAMSIYRIIPDSTGFEFVKNI